ncbi:hypothetical protein JHD46_05185 [Sulfurimonas sp. SAG-AH-194-C20]|nr:hypothetical protein [Sulfurimonas sp. SAG-AH-194-C20]MDF1879032.1 hypothetical protein [Sulfurimonas sp. SAG-AH-194-C20]
MTNKEISKLFEIPLSTINDWQKQDSNRYKLYQFLHASNMKDATDITTQQKNHRLLHILNRNIDKKNAYSIKEIENAFSRCEYASGSQREQVIYSKFFKECDTEDLSSLQSLLNISVRNVKQIYLSSPLRKLRGVRNIWDKRFRVNFDDGSFTPSNNSIPTALVHILNKRTANV